MYESLMFTIKGVAPLLMHNGLLADPLRPIVKEIKKISSKRKKTDADYEEMARLEWMGSLYVNEKGRLIIPGEVIKAMLIDAAKKNKLGKTFKSSVFCFEDPQLEYDGTKAAEKLWEDENFRKVAPVRVGQARVMRTRPMFKDWSLTFEIQYLPEIIDAEQIKDAVVIAGRIIGLCDWRPNYGRFEIKEFL